MTNYHDPHAEIFEIGFAPLSHVVAHTSIGSEVITLTATDGFLLFEKPQSASFSERQSKSGDYVEQEFEAVFTDSAAEFLARYRNLLDEDCLVLVSYTNNSTRVAGTDQAPVRCEIEESGSPKTLRVSFRRNSPEFAKLLSSLL